MPWLSYGYKRRRKHFRYVALETRCQFLTDRASARSSRLAEFTPELVPDALYYNLPIYYIYIYISGI